MPKLLSVPPMRQFRVVYWDEASKSMKLSDMVTTQSEAIKLANSLLGKHSNHNIEILTLVGMAIYDHGAGSSLLIPEA